MKKLFLMLLLGFCFTANAFADDEAAPTVDEDITVEVGDSNPDEALQVAELPLDHGIFKKFPEMKNALLFNWKDKDFDYAAMFSALQYKGFNLDVGYSPSSALVLGLSYEITNLEKLGVKIPLLKHIKLEPGIAYSLERINAQDISAANEGISIYANILEVRFW